MSSSLPCCCVMNTPPPPPPSSSSSSSLPPPLSSSSSLQARWCRESSLVWHRGESKVRHSVNVLCEPKQEHPDAHLHHYGKSASGRRTLWAGSAHWSLFDSMFNDRLTKDLQTRAGVDSVEVGFHCLGDASVLMCIIGFFNWASGTCFNCNWL